MFATRACRALAQADWNFPVKTLVGAGRRREIRDLLNHVCETPRSVAAAGSSNVVASSRRPLVVTDPHVAKLPWFEAFLQHIRGASKQSQEDGRSSSSWDVAVFDSVHPNPLESDVARAAEMFRQHKADAVVCIGGGSALDAGKCVAMLAESGFESLRDPGLDYFSGAYVRPPGMGRGVGRLTPCVAIPTTAGTGAEMDSGAMWTDETTREKRCAGHQDLPLAVILDPELSLGLPANLTAWTGMDAVVHALEAFFVPDCYHPLCDGAALQALRKLDANLENAVMWARDWGKATSGSGIAGGDERATGGAFDIDAAGPFDEGSSSAARLNHTRVRQEMLVGSALAGVAFQRGLGAVHGLSEPIGAMFDTHHGLTNAVLLPHFLTDLEVLTQKRGVNAYGQDMGAAKLEFEEKCKTLVHGLKLPDTSFPSTELIHWAEALNKRLEIPERLRDILPAGAAERSVLEEIAAKAERNPTGFTNAVRYSAEDYRRVLERAW